MISYSFVGEKGKMDALVVPVFEDKKFDTLVKDLNDLHEGLFDDVKKLKDFEAKAKQMTLLYTQDKVVPRILLVGMGKKKSMNVRLWKQLVGQSVVTLQGKKLQKIGYVLPVDVVKMFGAKKLGVETTVAIEAANYAFDSHKTKDARVKSLKNVLFASDMDGRQKKQFLVGHKNGLSIAEGVNLVRFLGNTPPTVMTPTYLAKESEKVAKKHKKMKIKVLSRPDMKRLGMGCLLGVSQGSQHEPKFIILEYSGGKKGDKPSVLVGKGITFDSGGLSLKPGAYMSDMKFDMLGAATVLGTIHVAAALGIKKNIVGLMPSCENMPSGTAYRPDDILTAMNGKSVLIDNTDAEGRLILADALSYATMKLKPKEVIDFATLTGACMVALGNERSGVFSHNDKIVERLDSASKEIGEQLWRLPLGLEYSEAVKCEIADIKNLGQVGGRGFGGASTAAAFLEFFTKHPKSGDEIYPWAHIDLSSCYWGGKGKPWVRGGANGFGVQTMIEYLS